VKPSALALDGEPPDQQRGRGFGLRRQAWRIRARRIRPANHATGWVNRRALLSVAGVDNTAANRCRPWREDEGRQGGMKRLTLACAVILSTLSVFSLQTEPIGVESIAVVDGDSINVGPQRYRLVGFDTPEIQTRRRGGPNDCAA
jgi:hypothetical protein